MFQKEGRKAIRRDTGWGWGAWRSGRDPSLQSELYRVSQEMRGKFFL